MAAARSTLVDKSSSSVADVVIFPPLHVVVVVVAYFIYAHAQGTLFMYQ